MYVFVTVAELTGSSRQLSLGQVEDNIPIRDLLKRCRQEISKDLPEGDRDISRHFWFQDRLVSSQSTFLCDVASSVNVTLELRPDYYSVKLPERPAERYAINPELPVDTTIDELLGFSGAWRCYQLAPDNEAALKGQENLAQQGVFPYHARQSQKEQTLAIRRKPGVFLLAAITVVLCVLMGLGIGYVLSRGIQGS